MHKAESKHVLFAHNQKTLQILCKNSATVEKGRMRKTSNPANPVKD